MSATAVAAPDITYEIGFRKWIIAFTAIVCSLIEVIDVSIVNVAINTLMGNLGATVEEASWVITAYAISNVIIIPLASFLADKLGRRPYFIGSIILFTISSLLCGTSTNIWELVFFRFIQGLGGGALLTTSQTILAEAFPPEERDVAMGIFGLGVVVGPTIGPTLGGYLIDNYSWHWIFFINIPVGILAASLAFVFVKQAHKGDKHLKIDIIGILLLVIGLGCLQYLLEEGQRKDWFDDAGIVWSTIFATSGLLGFLVWEWKHKEPAVNLRLLKSPSLAIGSFLALLFGFGIFASVFVFPLFTQTVLGWTALQTGMNLIPGALCTGFFMAMSGRILSKGLNPKLLTAMGFTTVGIFGYAMYSVTTPTAGESDFFIPLLIRGAGVGMIFVPITSLSLAGMHGRSLGQASGITNMIRQLGGSIGIAFMNTYIARRLASHRNDLVGNVSRYDWETQNRIQETVQMLMGQGFTPSEAMERAYKFLDLTIMQQSSLLTYADAFLMIGMAFIVGLPLIFLMRSPKKGESTPVDIH